MLDDPPGNGATKQYEPDDPTPEAEYGPEVPSVSIPDTTDADVPPGLARAFWSVVLCVNVGLLAASLGLMFAYFRGRLQLGGAGVVFGLCALGYGYLVYRRYEDGTD